jgi:hypothetical protein
MLLENNFEHNKICQALIMRSKKLNFLTLKLLRWIAQEDIIVPPGSLSSLIRIS